MDTRETIKRTILRVNPKNKIIKDIITSNGWPRDGGLKKEIDNKTNKFSHNNNNQRFKVHFCILKTKVDEITKDISIP